jgi:DNA-binding transcriptional LysR family regulator
VQAGLGWAFLPRALVQPLAAAGSLVEIAFGNISNQMRLWVDVVWSRERPLGVGARRYVDLMREAWRPAAQL